MLTALLALAVCFAFALGRVSTWAWIRTRPRRDVVLHGAQGKFRKAQVWEVD
jgi:hypothetical protein